MDNIEISRVQRKDLKQIVELQMSLTSGNGDPQNGFLVSGYRERDYKRFIQRGELLFKATAGERIVGAMVVLRSGSITPQDINNSLLKYTVNKDFLLVKQVFVSPDYGRRGIAARLYHLLGRVNFCGLPVVAVVVKDPPNTASMNFHRKQGFTEYLEFLPDADRDGRVRLRSAFILPARDSADYRQDVRVNKSGGFDILNHY